MQAGPKLNTMKLFYFPWMLLMVYSCVNETSNENNGQLIFEQNCVTCHGLKGNLQVSGASDLTKSNLEKEQLKKVIKEGRNAMNPYKNILSDSQIDAVANYVHELRVNK